MFVEASINVFPSTLKSKAIHGGSLSLKLDYMVLINTAIFINSRIHKVIRVSFFHASIALHPGHINITSVHVCICLRARDKALAFSKVVSKGV